MIILSVQQNGFLFTELNFSICYPSLSYEISPDFTQLDRGPPRLSTKQSLGQQWRKIFN